MCVTTSTASIDGEKVIFEHVQALDAKIFRLMVSIRCLNERPSQSENKYTFFEILQTSSRMTNETKETVSKNASWTTRFLVRYAIVFFMAYVFGGLFFLFSIQSTFNGGFSFSVKILFIPAALLIFGFTYLNRKYLAALHPIKPWVPWIYATLWYPLCILFGWPWVMAVNTLTIYDHPIIFKGPIIKKFTSGRGASYEITIKDTSSLDFIDLNVSRKMYHELNVGSEYGECFQLGLLGIPYKLKNSPPVDKCFLDTQSTGSNGS